MSRSKLSLILFSVLIASSALGASLGSGGVEYRLRSISLDGLKAGEGDADAVRAKKVFAQFCRGGKPLRSTKLELVIALPSVGPGIPVDTAAAQQAGASTLLKGYATGAFEYLSRAPKEKLAKQGQTVTTLFALEDNDPKSLLKGLKSGIGAGRDLDFAFFTVHGDRKVYLGLAYQNILTEYNYKTADGCTRGASACDGWQAQKAGSANANSEGDWAPRFFTVAEPLEVEPWSESKRTIYPLTETYLDEITLLRNAYTLLLPREWQEKHFKDLYAIDGENKLSLSKAVSQRDDLWAAYLRAMTTLKEQPQPDRQELRAEATLDLGPFCQFGRSLGDLTTK